MGENLLLRDVLRDPTGYDYRCWLYLPEDEPWSLDSIAMPLRDEDISPEEELDPDAGIPEIAKQNLLMRSLEITTVEEIRVNLQQQIGDPETLTDELLLEAFLYYYDNDAFMVLD